MKYRLVGFMASVAFMTVPEAHADRGVYDAKGIKGIMRKVNAFTQRTPYMETDRNWIRATYYTGVMGAYQATHEDSYLKQAMAWGQKHAFQPGTSERPGGNILTSAQTYLELYFIKKDKKMIQPTIDWLKTPAANTPAGGKPWYLEGLTVKRYADSLYVGPPALAMLAKATGDDEYLQLMDAFFWDVYDEIYDKEAKLFFRDKDFIYRRTKNGKKIYWSRGNGWVLAGLPRIMNYLPKDHPSYNRYKALYLELAESVLKLQHEDGLWRANLGDVDEYRMPESSGTAFFTYAYAWGINQGMLDREVYLPAIIKGWDGLCRSVLSTGKLGWVQPVDGEPRPSLPTSTHEYATGLFLLAGAEMLKLAESGQLKSSLIQDHLPDLDRLLPAMVMKGKAVTLQQHPLANKINTFKKRLSTHQDFTPTGLSRKDYLEVIFGQVKAMQKYQAPDGRIIDPAAKKETFYATPCYAHAVAALVAGKHPGAEALAESGMKALDVSLDSLSHRELTDDHSDFYTWPAMLAYELFGPIASKDRKKKWADRISQISPEKDYRHYRKPFEGREGNAIKTHWPFYNSFNKEFAHNWNVINSAGEYLRHRNGFTEIDYVDFCLGMQLPHFTNTGMYSEEGNPMSYDIFTRHYLAGMLQKGYRSALFSTYRDQLWKGAWTSMFLQSPTGEPPTGYRSSQHIWNEASQAALFEIYATHHAKAGMMTEASVFKRAAHLSLASIKQWIRPDGSGFIVKNRYPIGDKHGHEVYSMHTCYNMLACSILAQAWQFADSQVDEKPCPADIGGFVIDLPEFHKVIANVGNTYIEYDTKGDHVFPHHEYNPTGLIRIHLKDGNPQLGPSDGCAVGGTYYKQGSGSNYGVGPAWKDAQGNWTKLADFINITPKVEVLENTLSKARLRVTYHIKAEGKSPVTITQEITVKQNQVFVEDRVIGEGVQQVRIYYPMLVFDGKDKTLVEMSRNKLEMTLREKKVCFEIQNSLESKLTRSHKRLKHRNGEVEIIYFDVKGTSAKYRIFSE